MFPQFFMKVQLYCENIATNELLKILSIASDNVFRSFLARLKYNHSKSVHLLKLFKNQAILKLFHMSGTAD